MLYYSVGLRRFPVIRSSPPFRLFFFFFPIPPKKKFSPPGPFLVFCIGAQFLPALSSSWLHTMEVFWVTAISAVLLFFPIALSPVFILGNSIFRALELLLLPVAPLILLTFCANGQFPVFFFCNPEVRSRVRFFCMCAAFFGQFPLTR